MTNEELEEEMEAQLPDDQCEICGDTSGECNCHIGEQ